MQNIKNTVITMSYISEVIPHVRSVMNKINEALLSKEIWFAFPSESSDGRTNSQQGEPQVAEYINQRESEYAFDKGH